jgi:Methyltransferase domain
MIPRITLNHPQVAETMLTPKSGVTPGQCKVCDSSALNIVFDAKILGQHSAQLFECQSCGFQFFEDPSVWLNQAYSSPIANTDTGIVARSLNIHRIVSSFLTFANAQGKVLDWGSGSGLLVRLLRDDGHDCYGLEPYTTPVLAAAFTSQDERACLEQESYRVILAIEVVEHLLQPKDFFAKALSISDALIFSTELVDKRRNGNKWWYYSIETGQHISFYANRSLACLARLNGCRYASSRDQRLHIITRKSADLRIFSWLCGQRRARITHPIAQILGKLRGRRSLIMADHLAAKQALRSAQAKRSE